MVCIIALEILAIFINVDTKIEGIQIGDHEIKTVNFAYESTIFLRDFSCVNIMELSQKCSN